MTLSANLNKAACYSLDISATAIAGEGIEVITNSEPKEAATKAETAPESIWQGTGGARSSRLSEDFQSDL